MTEWDIEFYELSAIADDPKKLAQLKNSFADPEWDDFVAEFDAEQASKSVPHDDDYELPPQEAPDDWERVT